MSLPKLPLAFVAAAFLLAGPPAWSAPVEIVPPEFDGAAQPQVAVSPDGQMHVVFGKELAIFHTVSTDGGRSFSKPVRIAELPKLALGMRRGPRVSATGQLVTVSAISHTEGNLYAWTSRDGGKTWSEKQQINTVPNSAREGLHAMAGDGSGLTVLTWLDMRNGAMELWSAASRDGGLTWGENTRVYHSPDGHICECCHPSLAIGPGGKVAAMWRNWLGGSRDMYLAESSDGGTNWGAARKLGEGTWKLNGCPMDGGGVAFAKDGNPVTAWRREKSVFAADVNGKETLLAERALQPVVFPDAQGTGILWQAGTALALKRGDGKTSTLAESGQFPAVAVQPKGGAVVVWEGTAGGAKTLFADRVE